MPPTASTLNRPDLDVLGSPAWVPAEDRLMDFGISRLGAQGTFGSSVLGSSEPGHFEIIPREQGFERAPGSVTVESDGSTYVIGAAEMSITVTCG